MKCNKKLVLPLIISLTSYLLAYQIPKVLVSLNRVHYLKFPIDDMIPLFSPAIIIYILAFFQWSYTLMVVVKQKTEKGYYIASAIVIGSLIGMATFLIYPTGVLRPTIEVNNVFDWIIDKIYTVDSIVNACPSFHCFCSLVVIKALRQCEGVNKKCIIFNIIFSILVFASTVFTKQHYIIDIPFGLLLADIAFLIARKYPLTKSFNYINKLFNK